MNQGYPGSEVLFFIGLTYTGDAAADEAFDRWYFEVHVPEVSEIGPTYARAHRRIIDAGAGGDGPQRAMTVYVLPNEDAFAGLEQKVAGGAAMTGREEWTRSIVVEWASVFAVTASRRLEAGHLVPASAHDIASDPSLPALAVRGQEADGTTSTAGESGARAEIRGRLLGTRLNTAAPPFVGLFFYSDGASLAGGVANLPTAERPGWNADFLFERGYRSA